MATIAGMFTRPVLPLLLISLVAGVPRAHAAPIVDQNAWTWTDAFADESGIAGAYNVRVDPSDGQLKLTNAEGGFVPPFSGGGSADTTLIVPETVAQWDSLMLTAHTPAGTMLLVQVLDSDHVPYGEAILPGNANGFSAGTIDLSSVPVDQTAENHGKIARLSLRFRFFSSDTTATPSVDAASVSWTRTRGDLTASPLASTSWPVAGVDAQGTRRSRSVAEPVYQTVRWARSQQSRDFGGMLSRGPGEVIFNKTTGEAPSATITAMSTLAALDRRTGEPLWEHRVSGEEFSEISHALAQNGTLYIADLFHDVLLAYDTTAGFALKWTYQFFAGHGNARVAIGSDGTIYTIRSSVGAGIGTVYAFYPDGTVRWTRDIFLGHPDPGFSQIVLGASDELYFGAQATSGGDGIVYGLDPADGTDLWPPVAIGPYIHLDPVVDGDGTIYIASDSSTLGEKSVHAIASDGTTKWTRSIGITEEHWAGLALRSDGLLLAERVSSYGTSTAGAIEATDTATGSLAWSDATNSDNGAFVSDLFVDGADGYFVPTMLVGTESDLSYFDAAGNRRWKLQHDTGGNTAYFHHLMQDEDGALYGNLYRDATSSNTVIGFVPWTLDPCVRECEVATGGQLTVAVRTPMLQVEPISGGGNQMQLVIDNGDRVPLAFAYELNGAQVWRASYEVPATIAQGVHTFHVEANSPGMTTDVPVHFDAPASGSANTGTLATGRFGVGEDPCAPSEVCGLDSSAQACVNAMNKAGAAVAKAQQKLNGGCLKAAAGGSASMDQCIVDDADAGVQKAEGKIVDADALCGNAPAFGYAGAATVADAARTETQGIVHDLFGLPAEVIETASDSADAACQSALLQTVQKVAGAEAKIFLSCKKKLLPGFQVVSSRDLERCFDDILASRADAKGKVSKAVAKVGSTLEKNCDGSQLTTVIPPCGALPDAAACMVARVQCRTCRMFNRMDGLAEDCDVFDDAAANASCP